MLWTKMEAWVVIERSEKGEIIETVKVTEFLVPMGKDVPPQIGDLLLVPSSDHTPVKRSF